MKKRIASWSKLKGYSKQEQESKQSNRPKGPIRVQIQIPSNDKFLMFSYRLNLFFEKRVAQSKRTSRNLLKKFHCANSSRLVHLINRKRTAIRSIIMIEECLLFWKMTTRLSRWNEIVTQVISKIEGSINVSVYTKIKWYWTNETVSFREREKLSA